MKLYTPKQVYPYESYISIFYKLLRYTYLTDSDLLKVSGITYGRHRMPFETPSWLPASALGEGATHLPTRFAPPQQILNPANNIRFCPACIKMGFHSVFTFIKYYHYCAIHNVELIDMCAECRSRFMGEVPITSYFEGTVLEGKKQHHCEICSLAWPDLGHCFSWRVDGVFMAKVLEVSDHEAQWFEALMSRVLVGSYHCQHYYTSDEDREALAVPLERFLGISCPDRMAGRVYSHQPVHWITPECPMNGYYDYLDLQDYQHVRQTLYACCEALEEKYLRGHDDCLERINSLTEYGANTGIIGNFCSCALAYVMLRLKLACIKWPTVTSVSSKKSGFDCFIQRAPCAYDGAAITKLITACFLKFLGEIQYNIEKGISFSIVLNAEYPWYRSGKHQSFFIRRSSYRFRNACTQDLEFQHTFKLTRTSPRSGFSVIYADNELSAHHVLTL